MENEISEYSRILTAAGMEEYVHEEFWMKGVVEWTIELKGYEFKISCMSASRCSENHWYLSVVREYENVFYISDLFFKSLMEYIENSSLCRDLYEKIRIAEMP